MMNKRIILLLCIVLLVLISIQRDLYAAPLIPARIGGSVTVDSIQILQATDTGYTFAVTKQDGTDYNPVAEDMDGLNSSDWYVIDIPISKDTDQPGGAQQGDTAIIHVYLNGLEINVISPVNGQITVGNSGSINQIDIKAATNHSPSIPKLVFPEDGQQGLGTSLTFKWEKSSDPDLDAIIYYLYYSEDPSFIGSSPIQVVSLNKSKTFFAWNGIGLSLFGIALVGGIKGRKKLITLLIVTALIAVLLVSCGGGGGGGGGEDSSGGEDDDIVIQTTKVTHTVSGLNLGTTYYWKVVVDDSNGGVTESNVQSFTTQ